MALKGKNLTIRYDLKKALNQTEDLLTCFDPDSKQIYSHTISASAGESLLTHDSFVLKNMTISGEYYCQYKTAKAYWFLQVSGEFK